MSNWDSNPHRQNTNIGRGYLNEDVNTEKKMPRVKVTTARGQTVENIDFISPAGFGSRPAKGDKTEVLTFDPNGDPSQRVAMVIGDREHFRKGNTGATWLQAPGDKEQYIETSKDGIEAKAKDKPINFEGKEFNVKAQKGSLFDGKIVYDGTKITINCPVDVVGDVSINGNLSVNGNITATGAITP